MRIFRFVKKYWFWLILAPLFMVGEVLMDLYQPRLMATIVDDGLANGDLTLVWQTGLLMLGLVLIGGLMGVLCGVYTNKTALNFANDLRKEVFNHIQNLSYEQVDMFSTGSLVTRVTNDVTQVTNIVSTATRMLIRTLMQFVLGTVFLLAIDARFGYVLLVILPVILVVMTIFLVKVSPSFVLMQKRVDDINAIVQENVTGARVVKAYTAEDRESARFKTANDNLYNVNWNVFKKLALIGPMFSIILSSAAIAIMYIGGVTINNNYVNEITNGLNVGDIIAAVNYLVILTSGFVMLAMMFQVFVRGLASIRRLNEVLDTTPVVLEGEGNKNTNNVGAVEFKHVSFAYPGEVDEKVLNDINITISRGEKVGILGSTGSGKSTLVNLIARFYDVSEGEVLVDGVNVKEYSFDELRNKVAMVLQKSELFSETIANNIRWGKKDATLEEVIHASQIAQADDFITSFNEGYDTLIAEKGASLSGGQKQRISIARAIIKHPEIVIFDDSTSALDLSTEANLYAAIRKELADMTVITIAQRIASVKNCDKIIVLQDGMIDSIGTHEELLAYSPIYQDIYNSQLKKDGEENG